MGGPLVLYQGARRVYVSQFRPVASVATVDGFDNVSYVETKNISGISD
jgi:hypothetical protein